MTPRAIAIVGTLLLLYVGSGLYALAPGTAYLTVTLAALSLFADPSFRKAPFTFVEPSRLVGAVLFNSVVVLLSLASTIAFRQHLVHLLSLGVYVVAQGSTTLALKDRAAGGESSARILGGGAFTALLIIVLAQTAQLTGLLVIEGSDIGSPDISLGARPGGLLNANMSAGVALALTFIVVQLRQTLPRTLIRFTVALLILSLLLSQSRGGTLCAFLYLLAVLRTRRLSLPDVFLPLVIVLGFGFAVIDNASEVLIAAIALRLEPDFSFGERLHLARLGIQLIGDAPLLGHGYRFMEHIVGVSSHNEIIENAVNFGLLGSTLIWASFVLLYPLKHLTFVIACIAPALLFSHNFFETASLQVVLGVASVSAFYGERTPADKRAPLESGN